MDTLEAAKKLGSEVTPHTGWARAYLESRLWPEGPVCSDGVIFHIYDR